MRTIDVIVDDPSPERLWTVVHCSGATAWIKHTSVRKIQSGSEVEYVSKDCLIEIDLDSGKRTKLETFDGELSSITFTNDFIYRSWNRMRMAVPRP